MLFVDSGVITNIGSRGAVATSTTPDLARDGGSVYGRLVTGSETPRGDHAPQYIEIFGNAEVLKTHLPDGGASSTVEYDMVL